MRLQQKIVLVTAATRGIGLACVEACAAEGAQVFLAARDMQRGETVCSTLRKQGLQVQSVYCDAARPETLSSVVEDVIHQAGHLDVLVNNFGTSDPRQDRDFAHTDPQTFLDTVTINLRSVFQTAQAAARHMAKQGSGSIINISSVGGQVPDVAQIGYGTAKAAINYLTRLIALQEAKNHIRCNAVLPGMTATDAVKDKLTDSFRNLFVRHIPLGRMGLPEEIAAAVVYFASEESRYTTGQILSVSGGFGLGTPVYADLLNRNER